MANTFELISAHTITSTQSSITIGSGGTIPQTYTDLVLKISARTTNTGTFGAGIIYYYNGANSSLSTKRIYGQGNGGQGSTGGTIQYGGMASSDAQTASTFGNSEIYIPNYTGSSNKSSSSDGVSENNGTNNQMMLSANLWSSTAAITSITLLLEDASSFMTNSTFYLYGVKNA